MMIMTGAGDCRKKERKNISRFYYGVRDGGFLTPGCLIVGENGYIILAVAVWGLRSTLGWHGWVLS